MKYKNILRMVFTLILIDLIVYKVGPGKIAGAFQNLDWYFFVPALLISLLIFLFKSAKWFFLVRAEDPQITYFKTLEGYLAGLGLSVVTPSKVGELVRIFYLPRGDRLRLSGLVIIDKIFDFLAVGALSFNGALYFLGWKFAVLAVAISFLTGLSFFYPPVIMALLRPFGGWLPFRDKLKSIVFSLNLLTPRLVFQCFLLTFGAFLAMTFQFHLFLRAFGPAGLKVSFLCYPLVLLTNLFPFTIGNLGVREGAAALLLGRFGISQPAAVNAAFLVFLANSVMPGLLGSFFFGRLKISGK